MDDFLKKVNNLSAKEEIVVEVLDKVIEESC